MVAQHDQWYWSMVSTICYNVAGDTPGHVYMSLVIDPPFEYVPSIMQSFWCDIARIAFQ